MSGSPVTLDFIGKQLVAIQAEQRPMRADFDTMMALVVGQNDWNRQFEARLVGFEQRLVEQADILVSEFKGRIGISQSMTGRHLDDIEERLQELETGKSRFTP